MSLIKNIFLLTTVSSLFFCQIKEEKSEVKIPCDKIKTPDFDGKKVSLLNEKGIPIKDTIIEKIPKYRIVFSPCKEYVFRAIYKDENNNLLSNGIVRLKASGKRWDYQPEIQDEIIIEFTYNQKDEHNLRNSKINSSLINPWEEKDTTGIIENEQQIWMHPFRRNQYFFTEIAPFPQVQFPLEIGRTWSDHLSLGEGWGDWENTSYSSSFKVVGKDEKNFGFGSLKECWKIESESSGNNLINKLTYWFNPEHGFIEMNYTNYWGETLSFKLEEIIYEN